MRHSGLLEPAYAAGRNVQREQVIVALAVQLVRLLGILVDEDDVLILFGEEFSEMSSHCTCAGDDDFHWLWYNVRCSMFGGGEDGTSYALGIQSYDMIQLGR